MCCLPHESEIGSHIDLDVDNSMPCIALLSCLKTWEILMHSLVSSIVAATRTQRELASCVPQPFFLEMSIHRETGYQARPYYDSTSFRIISQQTIGDTGLQ